MNAVNSAFVKFYAVLADIVSLKASKLFQP